VRAADLMDEIGLTDRALIENYLVPLLDAKETKFFVIKNKLVTRNVEALGLRTLRSTLHSSFADLMRHAAMRQRQRNSVSR
jgi:hypothetical protein